MFEQVLNAGKGDVVISVSFPRYSKRTVKATQFVKNQGATTIAITDSKDSPLAEHSDYKLLARRTWCLCRFSRRAVKSDQRPDCCHRNAKERAFIQGFRKLERIWDEYEVYEKSKSIKAKYIRFGISFFALLINPDSAKQHFAPTVQNREKLFALLNEYLSNAK